MDTEKVWRQHMREYHRNLNQRDRENANEGRMTASVFARLHNMNPKVLRHRMRKANYKRVGNRQHVPIKDLEKFL